jgi:hypothetical protein
VKKHGTCKWITFWQFPKEVKGKRKSVNSLPDPSFAKRRKTGSLSKKVVE